MGSRALMPERLANPAEFARENVGGESADGGRIAGYHPGMELRHLRYFMAAAEEEHFGRASDRLHVTRPAVSQIIADLESELDTQLFERLSHRVRLTAAGASLLPRVQSLMKDLSSAVETAKLVGKGKSGALSIGYGSLTLLNVLFRATIKQYRETYPDVHLSLVQLSTTEQQKALADGRIHAGFMHFGPSSPMIRKQRRASITSQNNAVLEWFNIQNGGLGVAVPNDHPLARRKSATLADLIGERFVVVPRSATSPGYGPLFTLCQKAGFEPNIVQEVESTTILLNLISVGLGIGLIVKGHGFAYPANLSVIPITRVQYTTTFLLGWVKGRKDPALDRMIEIIEALQHQDAAEPAEP